MRKGSKAPPHPPQAVELPILVVVLLGVALAVLLRILLRILLAVALAVLLRVLLAVALRILLAVTVAILLIVLLIHGVPPLVVFLGKPQQRAQPRSNYHRRSSSADVYRLSYGASIPIAAPPIRISEKGESFPIFLYII